MTKPQSPHIRSVRAGKKMANAYAKQFGMRGVSMATKAKDVARGVPCCPRVKCMAEYGLHPAYAKLCHDELVFLQPEGYAYGLLELCKAARKLLTARGRKREGSKRG